MNDDPSRGGVFIANAVCLQLFRFEPGKQYPIGPERLFCNNWQQTEEWLKHGLGLAPGGTWEIFPFGLSWGVARTGSAPPPETWALFGAQFFNLASSGKNEKGKKRPKIPLVGYTTEIGNWTKQFVASANRVLARDAADRMQWERRVHWAFFDSMLGLGEKLMGVVRSRLTAPGECTTSLLDVAEAALRRTVAEHPAKREERGSQQRQRYESAETILRDLAPTWRKRLPLAAQTISECAASAAAAAAARRSGTPAIAQAIAKERSDSEGEKTKRPSKPSPRVAAARKEKQPRGETSSEKAHGKADKARKITPEAPAAQPAAQKAARPTAVQLRSEVNNSLIIVNFFHKIQNFRQISDLFSQI